jgi:hypothetical protein
MSKAGRTLAPEPILALSERLRRHAQKARHPVAADLRLASIYLQRLASLAIVDQAAGEKDPHRKQQLEAEAVSLWGRCHDGM